MASISKFVRWLDAWTEDENRVWYVKRLSGNDTSASGSHQSGIYFPTEHLFAVFPRFERSSKPNPDARINLTIRSTGGRTECMARAVWYNNKHRGGQRDEGRITNLGGAGSPLLNSKNTGRIAVFAFDGEAAIPDCRVWVCESTEEEEHFRARFGPVDAGRIVPFEPLPAYYTSLVSKHVDERTSEKLNRFLLPRGWTEVYPPTMDITRAAVKLLTPKEEPDPDKRLSTRLHIEFQLFLKIQSAIEMAKIRKGYDDLDAFIDHANSVTQGRKSRAGKSLEHHVHQILKEAGMVEKEHFQFQPTLNGATRRPDFIFPSVNAYNNKRFPAADLRVLECKRTARERWKQVVAQAGRVRMRHVLSVAGRVTKDGIRQMKADKVQLVIPEPCMEEMGADEHRKSLMSVKEFLVELGELQQFRWNGGV